jgi:serine/threonine protein phosphatase PrpC
MFRTTNITLWQKQREEGFTDGMATTMLVCLVIDRHFYIGSVGDSSAYLLRDGNMTKLTKEDIDADGRLTKAMGTTRYGLVPRVSAADMLVHDCIMLMTDGLAREMDTDKCVKLFEGAGQSAPQLSDVAVGMLTCARDQGATDNMTVVLIKRMT